MPELGNGYDSATLEEKSLSIFDTSLKSKKIPYVTFDFSSFIYRNTEDYLRKFSGTSQLSAVISSSVSLNSALEFSSDLRRDQDDLIYVIQVLGVRTKEIADIKEQAFKADPQMQAARQELKASPDDFWSKYGDHFISSILYGREVAIVIKFKKASAEAMKKRGINLEAKFANVASLKQAVDYLKTQSTDDLKCEIFIQAKGLEPSDLPPSDPNNFAELAKWLDTFEVSFKNTPASEISTPVGFEVTSYGALLPSEALVVVEKGNLKAKYFFAIKRCAQLLDFYIEYFDWLNDTAASNEFILKKQELESIKQSLEKKSSTTDPVVINNVKALRDLINALNQVKIGQKLINSFNAARDLSGDVSDGSLKTTQRISRPFQIQTLPPGEASNFFFKINNSKPLKGKLSFYYSLDKKVSYNSGSHRIASEIAANNINEADVPLALDKTNIRDMYFAYHYDTRNSTLEGLRNLFASPEPEDFSVQTYLGGTQPAPILTLPTASA